MITGVDHMTILSSTWITYHSDQVFILTHTLPVIGQGLNLDKLFDTILVRNLRSRSDGKADTLQHRPEGWYIWRCIHPKSHTIP